MAIFYPLFSGSSGNSTLITANDKSILIDIGVSCRKMINALSDKIDKVSDISAIFITHQHSDHINGLKVFIKKYNIPVFCSAQTAQSLRELYLDEFQVFDFEDKVEIDGFLVKRFNTSHDCLGSSGFKITTPDNKNIAVCTDLGFVSDEVHNNLIGCDLVMIESNHEVSMLQSGSYPYELKRRILSDNGHLSNSCCAEEIAKLVENGCKRFIISHISKDNNHPLIALNNIETTLSLNGYTKDVDYIIQTATEENGKMMIV